MQVSSNRIALDFIVKSFVVLAYPFSVLSKLPTPLTPATILPVPRYNNIYSPGKWEAFEKLQIILLMLIMLVPTAISFLLRMHAVHTHVRHTSDFECFLYTVARLAIDASLFAVLIG